MRDTIRSAVSGGIFGAGSRRVSARAIRCEKSVRLELGTQVIAHKIMRVTRYNTSPLHVCRRTVPQGRRLRPHGSDPCLAAVHPYNDLVRETSRLSDGAPRGAVERRPARSSGAPSGSSGPFAENVWITSSSWVRCIYARCCSPTRATITELALTGLWTRTRPCVGPFRGLAGCNHVPFLADFITNTSGSSFRYTQVDDWYNPQTW